MIHTNLYLWLALARFSAFLCSRLLLRLRHIRERLLDVLAQVDGTARKIKGRRDTPGRSPRVSSLPPLASRA